ncbi:MAG: heme exporter protein CcmB [Myxococcales bacterium]|nr:heme exporter protein CcmB [Myxococcales bacterium]MCB9642252.1 heme exporter protein CcmB [Myxococcales bacterium]
MSFAKQVWALFKKDLRLEWRSREMVTTMFFFTFLSLTVFGLSLQASPSVQRQVVSGLLWATLAFAGTLGMGRIYSAEQEDGALNGLRMAPVAYEAIFVSKHLSLFLFMLSCALWSVPLAAFMFQADITMLWPDFLPVLFLGLWGFSIIGTLMATLLLHSRFREALLPLLFLPLVLPILISGARATAELLGVAGLPQTSFWVRGFLIFDLLFFVLGLWLYTPQLEQ